MSDGHGSLPETPPGWSAEQPPPYSAPPASPWTAPGSPQQGLAGQPYEQAPATPRPPYPGHPYGHGYMPPPPALRPGIIPLRPLRLGEMLDGAIKLFRSNPKAVLGLSAVAALVVSIPVAVAQGFFFNSATIYTDPVNATPDDVYGAMAGLFGGSLVSLAVQFVVVTILTGVLTRILGRAVFGGTMSAGEAWRLSRGRMPALFGVLGLMAVIMVAPLIVFVVLVVAVVVSAPAEMIGLVDLVVLLMLPFGFLYYMFFKSRFAFAPAAVVLEGRGPLDAMRRSWRLVTGDFWRVFGIVLLTWVLCLLVSNIIGFPFSLFGTAAGVLGGTTAVTAVVSALFLVVGYTLSAMLTYPFEAAVAGLLYADRRMRGEAFDLVLQTAAVEQQRQGWVHESADDLWHPSNSAGS
ncbi:hypothetical protein [Nonomuraea maritima]|uniref:hypothetical protein n=1 Tax=Nonomuraea maritima TaxID=683260 RepID=UPI00371A4C18